MSVLDTAARWIAGKSRLANDLPAAEARLTEIEANPPSSIDPAEHLAWAENRDTERRNVEALRSALAIATAEAAKAEAAQQMTAEDAAHAAEEKAARADEKIVREIEALARKLAAKRDELAASIERTADANARRGARPFIANGEERVRQRPARTIPAVTQRITDWFNEDGERPSQLRDDGTGRMVPACHGNFQWREVELKIAAERYEPASMPQSFVTAFALVDLAGNKL